MGLHLGPIRKRLVNAETPVRSQYALGLGKLSSPLHVLQSIGCPVLSSKAGLCYCWAQRNRDSSSGNCNSGSKHCSDGMHSWARLPGESAVCNGNTSQLDRALGVSVTATGFWTAKPPGTDTLKSHLLGSGGKTNLITAFILQKSPWVLWVNPRGQKQEHLRKSFRGHVRSTTA